MKNLFTVQRNVPVPLMVGGVILFGMALAAPVSGHIGPIEIAQIVAFLLYLTVSYGAIRAGRNAMSTQAAALFLEKAGMTGELAATYVHAKAVRFILLAYGAALVGAPSWAGGRLARAEAMQTLGAHFPLAQDIMAPFLELGVRLGVVMLLIGAIVLREGWETMRVARLNGM